MLGRQLVAQLLQRGVAVRAYVRPGSDVGALQKEGVMLAYGDAANGEAMARAVQDVRLIFHAAAYLSVSAPFGGADESPLYEAVNVDFTARLLEAAQEAGVWRFVFASSNSVYAPDAPVPTPEEAPIAPGSAYGRSKVAAEGLVRAFQERGLATTIVRPAVIYGPGDRYFTPTALRLARLPLLPLVNGGEALFDMVHAHDVARLMIVAAHSEQARGRTYNAGPGEQTSLRRLAAAYGQVKGRAPRIVAVSPAAARRFSGLGRRLLARLAPGAEAAMSPEGLALMERDLHLDMSRAARELGYRPQVTLEEGLRRTLIRET